MRGFGRSGTGRRVPRPVAALAAVAVGLGAAGGAAGMVLGAVGTASAGPEIGGHHHGLGDREDLRGDLPGPDGPGGPGPRPGR